MSISTNQLKSGNHVEVDGTVYKVIEFQHVNPGKGAAFVRTKLRRASDGAVIDKTFRAGEKLRSVRSEGRNMQFLYADGDGAHFMNTETYDQIALPTDALKDALKWIKAGDQVDVLFLDDKPADVQVPGSVGPRGDRDRARPARRHRVGRRHQAGHARDRRRGSGSAVHLRGRDDPCRHARGEIPVAGVAGELVYGKHSVRAVFLRRPGDVRRVILGGKPSYHSDTVERGAAGRRRARARGLAGVPPR